MKGPWVPFDRTVEGVKLMAAFCAQLTRECIAFCIKADAVGYEVHLGGF